MEPIRLTRFGLIGAGGVGKKRAACLRPEQLVAVCDINRAHAESLVGRLGYGRVVPRAEDLIHDPGIDAVIISTLHDSLASLALQAIRAGKHVLVEKPAARHAAELVPLLAAEQERQVRVRIGYNHRYHPALQQARRIVDSGAPGGLSCCCGAAMAMADALAMRRNGAPILSFQVVAS